VTELQIVVAGRPAPEGSHEQGANGYIMHSSLYLRAWRAAVDRGTREAYIVAGLGKADMPLIGYPRPAWVSVWHLVGPSQCRAADTDEPTGKPDGDKLLRATVDGLGDAHAFGDDSQIVGHRSFKLRTGSDDQTGACILITDVCPWWARNPNEGDSEMTPTGEYRIVLERVGRDSDGDRTWESMIEATDTIEGIRDVWLPSLGMRLGIEAPTAAEPLPMMPAPEEPTEEKPKRTRRTKAPVAAEHEAARGDEVVPVPEPVADVPPAVPAAPAVPTAFGVNPFARPQA
jgi:hypothetical protein